MLQLNCALQLWCKEHEPTFHLGQQQEVMCQASLCFLIYHWLTLICFFTITIIVFQEDNGGYAVFLTNYAKQNVAVHIKNIPLEYVNRSRTVFWSSVEL